MDDYRLILSRLSCVPSLFVPFLRGKGSDSPLGRTSPTHYRVTTTSANDSTVLSRQDVGTPVLTVHLLVTLSFLPWDPTWNDLDRVSIVYYALFVLRRWTNDCPIPTSLPLVSRFNKLCKKILYVEIFSYSHLHLLLSLCVYYIGTTSFYT